MATVEPSSVAAELARSLAQDEIPIKMRCAICNRLAVNAFRLPCCDQAICETCQVSLPVVCPVCEHSPISAADCKPNKALRTTVKVFLKQQAQKLEKAKPQTLANTQVRPVTPSVSATVLPETAESNAAKPPTAFEDKGEDRSGSRYASISAREGAETDDKKDIPQESIEGPQQDHDPSVGNMVVQATATANGVPNGNSGEDGGNNVGEGQRGTTNGMQLPQDGQWAVAHGLNQGQVFGDGFGFNVDGFPNMGWNGAMDFNQIRPNVQNNMPGAWGSFPNMMGMPNMAMDPLGLNQGMYGGFGGQGLGMSGMNGVSMGGVFNAGQGGYGGWNGQQSTSWNGGQDNFNPIFNGANAMGMGNDFGANSGYHSAVPNSGAFNHHGNYGQMQQHYNHNEYQNGFNSHGQGHHHRGRGSSNGYNYGGRGRGGFKPAHQGNHEPFHHQLPTELLQQRQSSQQQEQKNTPKGEPDTLKIEADEKLPETETAIEIVKTAHDDNTETKLANDANTDTSVSPTVKVADVNMIEAPAGKIEVVEDTRPAPIETYTGDEPTEPSFEPTPIDTGTTISAITISTPTGPAPPLGPAALYQKDASQNFASRGRGGARGYTRGVSDYRGGFRGRGTGYLTNGTNVAGGVNGSALKVSPTQSTPTADFPVIVPATPVEPKGLGVDGAPKAPKALREGLPNTGLRGGRGFSTAGRAGFSNTGNHVASVRNKSKSPDRRRSKSRSRSRSRSPERRHRRRHRHRSSSSSGDDSERERRRERRHRRPRKHGEDSKPGELNGELERDSSVQSSRRESYRSRRDRDDRHEKDDRSSQKHKTSSHRSHREKSRDRDRSREHRHRSRKDEAQANGINDDINQDNRQITSPSSSRRKEKDREYPTNKRDGESDRKRSRRERSPSLDDSEYERHRSRRIKRDDPPPPSHKDREKKAEVPQIDPHTLEREARNRERMLKEQQRRESLTAEREKKDRERKRGKGDEDSVGGKKLAHRNSRDGDDRKARRVSYKYEDEESDEARALRVENEREASRWG